MIINQNHLNKRPVGLDYFKVNETDIFDSVKLNVRFQELVGMALHGSEMLSSVILTLTSSRTVHGLILCIMNCRHELISASVSLLSHHIVEVALKV